MTNEELLDELEAATVHDERARIAKARAAVLARMAGPDEVVVPGYTDAEPTIIRMCKTPGELEQLFDAGLRHKSSKPRDYLQAWLNIARMFGYATKDDSWGELEKLLTIVFRRMVMAERAARPNNGGIDDQAK